MIKTSKGFLIKTDNEYFTKALSARKNRRNGSFKSAVKYINILWHVRIHVVSKKIKDISYL